ncbi:MAG: hypothetical protein IPP63_08455 [Chloracidobacterium sp.]|nr:hypothetical protein [Chloracidobacterium sp.]
MSIIEFAGSGRSLSEAYKMGKIVKYCNSCDENFAEKFGFCPNCGAALQAFEMSPFLKTAVDKAAVVASTSTPEPPMPVIIAAPEPIAVVEPVVMKLRPRSRPRR